LRSFASLTRIEVKVPDPVVATPPLPVTVPPPTPPPPEPPLLPS